MIKVLVVCSGNNYRISRFITEQVASLQKKDVYIDYYLIKGKGLFGYIGNLSKLKNQLKSMKYDLIHAHYGFSGMFSVLQRKYPVIITFIGEMNFPLRRIISKIALRFSAFNIFVSEELRIKSKVRKNYAIIPYGVNLRTFIPLKKIDSRKALNLPLDKQLALFSSTFDRVVKNYPLAQKAIDMIDNLDLVELSREYKRHEVIQLFNACDLLLMTSAKEGSPQVIKEAMACNCPIVSTDVGDIKQVIGNTEGCYISSFRPEDIAEKIKLALAFGKKTAGRDKIKHLDTNVIAKHIISVYNQVLSDN